MQPSRKHSAPGRALSAHALVAAVLGLVLLLRWLTGVNCIVRRIFGVPCPCCGMTRAALALLRGDLSGSLAAHPMLLPAILGILLVAHRGHFGRMTRLADVLAILCAASVAVCYVLRLAAGTIP